MNEVEAFIGKMLAAARSPIPRSSGSAVQTPAQNNAPRGAQSSTQLSNPALQDLPPQTPPAAQSPASTAERLTYREAFERFAALDPFAATTTHLIERLQQARIDVPAGLETDRDACLDLMMSTLIGPNLGAGRITFVYDYPASQGALARLRGPVASRFEVYLNGLELANGFHELGDATEQRGRFEHDLAERRRRGLPTAPLDEHFLSALEKGLPDCAGVALGFDRLVMCAAQAAHIREVLAFGFEEEADRQLS